MPETEESTDRLLASYTAAGTSHDFAVAPSALSTLEKKGWAAEYFKLATPPAGATKARVTSVKVKLKAYTLSNTDPTVGVFTADATPKPGAAIGSPAPLSRTGLQGAAYTPVTATFGPDVFLADPNAAYYLIVKGSDPVTPSAYLQYLTPGGAGAETHMEWSTNGGSTWQPAAGNWNAQDLWFEVWGRYTITMP